MAKILNEIRTIGAGLAILYFTSLLVYLQSYINENFQFQASVLIFLFFVLLIGTVGVIQLREWGRFVVVAANALMGIYLLKPFLTIENLIPISYLFMNVIIFLFFNQAKVKNRFSQSSFAGTWKSVLIIDDDEILIKTIRPFLIGKGYSVLAATTGEDGLQIVKMQKPDLVILDVILPGLKGREVCRLIKENDDTKDIPVVFLTAKDSPDDIAAEKRVGAIGHLTKPVQPKDLLDKIQSVLN